MLIPKKSFRCTKCWKYSPKIKCLGCFPSPCFPLHCCRSRPDPKIDFDKYREWDEWYVDFYMMEFDHDPEAIYEIGASVIQGILETREITKLLRHSEKTYRPYKFIHLKTDKCLAKKQVNVKSFYNSKTVYLS